MPKPGYRADVYASRYTGQVDVTTLDADVLGRLNSDEQVYAKPCRCENPIPMEDAEGDWICFRCGRRLG